MMQGKQFMEKEIMMDVLASQKAITGSYNTMANECATPAVKTDFINILNEEHQIQSEVFGEMQKRGWYPIQNADQNKINQTKQQYSAQ